jgi:hypothetical protein
MSSDIDRASGKRTDECGGLDQHGAMRDGRWDLLVDTDDDGTRRVVFNDQVIFDQINAKRIHLGGFSRKKITTKAEVILRLAERNFMTHAEKQRINAEIQRQARDAERLVHQAVRIQHPPGFWLDRFLHLLFSKKSYERVYSQMIIDMREEYFEALSLGRLRTAQWTVIRCYCAVLWAWTTQIPIGLFAAAIKKLSGS